MDLLKISEIDATNEIQEQFEAAQRRYYRAYMAGGDCGTERDAYYAARRQYNEAVAKATAALRAEIAKWR